MAFFRAAYTFYRLRHRLDGGGIGTEEDVGVVGQSADACQVLALKVGW